MDHRIYCALHTKEKVTNYCNNSECKKPICRLCIEAHSSHEIFDTAKMKNIITQKITQNILRNRRMKDEIDSRIGELNAINTRNNKMLIEFKSRIQDFQKEVALDLEKKEKEANSLYEKEIKERVAQQLIQLGKRKEELELKSQLEMTYKSSLEEREFLELFKIWEEFKNEESVVQKPDTELAFLRKGDVFLHLRGILGKMEYLLAKFSCNFWEPSPTEEKPLSELFQLQAEYKNTTENIQKKIDSLQEENNKLNIELSQYIKNLDTEKNQNQKAAITITNLKEELAKVDHEKALQKHSYREYQNKIEALQYEIEEIKRKYQSLELKVSEVEQEKLKAISETINIKEKLSDATKECDNLKNTLDSLQSQIESQKHHNTDLVDELFSAQDQLKNLVFQLNSSKEENDKIKEETSNMMKDYINKKKDEERSIEETKALALGDESLKDCKTLELISILKNQLNKASPSKSKSKMMKKTKEAEEFFVSIKGCKNYYLAKHVYFIVACLKAKEFSFMCNEEFGNEGARALSLALSENLEIQELNLPGCGIGPEGGKALGEALKDHPSVTTVCLSKGIGAIGNMSSFFNNSIQDEGAKAFAETLKINKTLLRVSFDHNEISNSGVSSLIEASKCNKTLRLLDISWNKKDKGKIQSSRKDLSIIQ